MTALNLLSIPGNQISSVFSFFFSLLFVCLSFKIMFVLSKWFMWFSLSFTQSNFVLLRLGSSSCMPPPSAHTICRRSHHQPFSPSKPLLPSLLPLNPPLFSLCLNIASLSLCEHGPPSKRRSSSCQHQFFSILSPNLPQGRLGLNDRPPNTFLFPFSLKLPSWSFPYLLFFFFPYHCPLSPPTHHTPPHCSRHHQSGGCDCCLTLRSLTVQTRYTSCSIVFFWQFCFDCYLLCLHFGRLVFIFYWNSC